jgi:hypothetical protein
MTKKIFGTLAILFAVATAWQLWLVVSKNSWLNLSSLIAVSIFTIIFSILNEERR